MKGHVRLFKHQLVANQPSPGFDEAYREMQLALLLFDNQQLGIERMDKRVLLSLSRQELLRQGYNVVPPSEGSQLVAGNLVALDAQTERILIVYVTTPLQAQDLWLYLLGEDSLHKLISEPKSNSLMSFHVHTWSERFDGGYSCTTFELTSDNLSVSLS